MEMEHSFSALTNVHNQNFAQIFAAIFFSENVKCSIRKKDLFSKNIQSCDLETYAVIMD